MNDNPAAVPRDKTACCHPLPNRILIPDLQREIEKQFDVKEDTVGSHSYAKYNNWDKVPIKCLCFKEKHDLNLCFHLL